MKPAIHPFAATALGLLVLVVLAGALVAWNRNAVWWVFGLLWLLGQASRSKSSVKRQVEADQKADDEARERLLLLRANASHNEEEEPWK